MFCWRFSPDLGGQLQEQRISTPRNLQQLTTPIPHLAFKSALLGFPGGPAVKNLPANAGEMDSTITPGRSHVLQGNTLPYQK